MSEEQKNEEKKPTINTEDFINEMKRSNEAVVKKLDELKTKPKEEEKKDDDDFLNWLKDDDDKSEDENSDKITMTKDSLTRLVKDIQDKTEKKVSAVVKEELNSDKKKNYYDQLAYKDFPMLADASSEFTREVIGVMDQIAQETKSTYKLSQDINEIKRNDPHLLYSAAARVKSKFVEDGKYVPQIYAKKEQRNFNSQPHGFSGIMPRSNSEQISEQALEYAKKFNLKPSSIKRMQERIKNSSR